MFNTSYNRCFNLVIAAVVELTVTPVATVVVPEADADFATVIFVPCSCDEIETE